MFDLREGTQGNSNIIQIALHFTEICLVARNVTVSISNNGTNLRIKEMSLIARNVTYRFQHSLSQRDPRCKTQTDNNHRRSILARNWSMETSREVSYLKTYFYCFHFLIYLLTWYFYGQILCDFCLYANK